MALSLINTATGFLFFELTTFYFKCAKLEILQLKLIKKKLQKKGRKRELFIKSLSEQR